MAMTDFTITVKRSGHSGQLAFESDAVKVDTKCWWDPAVVIEAGDYECYATRMATKKDSVTGENRPGIWLGKGVKYAKGTKTSDAIFVHEGKNASWSDGCIVAARGEVIKIWNAINPKGKPNVLVRVLDETASV